MIGGGRNLLQAFLGGKKGGKSNQEGGVSYPPPGKMKKEGRMPRFPSKGEKEGKERGYIVRI